MWELVRRKKIGVLLSIAFREESGDHITHRLYAVKLLPFLYLLQLANVLERRLLKMLPHLFHLEISL